MATKMGNVNEKGIRYLTPAESKEKTKNWPKSKGSMTHKEKMELLGDNSSSFRG